MKRKFYTRTNQIKNDFYTEIRKETLAWSNINNSKKKKSDGRSILFCKLSLWVSYQINSIQ